MASELPFLPSEVITNILKRLPIKSILRFQCVCKEWKNLFKTTSFTHDNYHFSPDHNNPFLLLFHETMIGHPHSLPLLNHNMQISESLTIPNSLRNLWTIIASCNGLICMLRYNGGDGVSNAIWVWNPVIREVRKIPLTTLHYRGSCGNRCGFGFGHSSVVNDYKIVRFYNQAWRTRKEVKHDYDGVEVFSLSTGSWKELEFEFGNLGMRTRFVSGSVNMDGTICWISKRDTSYIIVSFNVATEVFTLIPLEVSASRLNAALSDFELGVYDGKLEVHTLSIWFPHSIHVWVMEEVTSESGKRFIPVKKYKFAPMEECAFPMCIWKHEIVCISAGLAGGLTLFNLITNERRHFNGQIANTLTGLCNYEKSLVSVWNNKNCPSNFKTGKENGHQS